MTGTRLETLQELHFTSWLSRDFGCPLWLADRLWPLVCQRLLPAQAQSLTHGTGMRGGISDHDLRGAISPHTLLLACDAAFPTGLQAPRPLIVREVENAILQRMRHADVWHEGTEAA